ncbi:carbohydrate kinase family protein [Reinekea sp.]|jgi:pseudouridine kinase|uniref:carbohydrate kinase family protein n=1 Tax=Reinekea sp. TaxID=1970455 RepID=UPI002A7FB87C|nr:carbohydrate kinase family protein [Reinekea sp.]
MTTTRPVRTLIVGGANLDITGSCFSRFIPGDSNPGLVKNSAGGVGRNIAENLQRLGIESSLLTVLGEDIGQTLILRSCTDAGVDTSPVIIHPSLTTGTYMAINNQLGALLAAIADMGIIETLTPEQLALKKDYFTGAEQIILEANLPEDSIQWICSNNQNKSIHADGVSATKAPRLRSVLAQLDILKVNRYEAAAILQENGDDLELAQNLHQRGVKHVLLSQGPQGVILHNQAGTWHKSAIKGDNENDTGAGDSLFAGFVAARHLLSDPADQLEFAIACATFTLNSTASVNPKLGVQEIRRLFLTHLDKGAWSS